MSASGHDLGNLLNRVVSMTERYLGGVFATKGAPLPQDAGLREKSGGLADRIAPLMDRAEFHTALGEIWDAVRMTNNYLEATAPWTLNKHGKKDEVAGVLLWAAESLRILAVLLSPFIPSSSRRILEQIGAAGTPLTLEIAKTWDFIKMGTRVQKAAILFPRIDAEQP